MKIVRKETGVHNQIWVLGKLWNVKYLTEKLEAENPVKKLFYLLDTEALKKNTDNKMDKLGIRIIMLISSC